MENLSLIYIDTQSPEYKQVWQLREEVLRKPLGLSLKNEDLSGDAKDVIIAAVFNNEVIGCVILHHIDDSALKLRAMAVAQAWQGKQIGKYLVTEAERYTHQKDYRKIILNARQVAIGFYLKLGYIITSDIFTEVGIPHVIMEKMIDSSQAAIS